jgi:hypothetical protein
MSTREHKAAIRAEKQRRKTSGKVKARAAKKMRRKRAA